MLTKIIREDGTELEQIKSCTFTEQVNSETDLRLGCVAAASIEIAVFGEQENAINKDEKLTYYQVAEDGTETKIGVFYAQPTIATKHTYTFTAYDAVSKLDKDFSEWLNANQDSFPMTLLELASQAASVASVTLTDDLTFPLSDLTVEAFLGTDISCRNIFAWIAEIAGRFVRCNADGEIIFDWYTTVATPTINPTDGENYIYYKQDGLSYENYTTSPLDRVIVYPLYSEGTVYVYPEGTANGNTYEVSNNMLLTNASAETHFAIAENIYNILSTLGTYKPFNVQLFPFNNPYRAGQRISVTDSQGVTFNTLVMSMTVNDTSATLSSTGGQEYSGASSLGSPLTEIQINVNKAVANLDQATIFDRLTNGGISQGIYLQDRLDEHGQVVVDDKGNPIKDLYINMSFARTGTLQLGGSNNELGIAQILDSDNKVISQWDRTGLKTSAIFVDGSSESESYINIPRQVSFVDFKASTKNLDADLPDSPYPWKESSEAIGEYLWVYTPTIYKMVFSGGTVYSLYCKYQQDGYEAITGFWILGIDSDEIETDDTYYATLSNNIIHLPNRHKIFLDIYNPEYFSDSDLIEYIESMYDWEHTNTYIVYGPGAQMIYFRHGGELTLATPEDIVITSTFYGGGRWVKSDIISIENGLFSISKEGLHYYTPITKKDDEGVAKYIDIKMIYSEKIDPVYTEPIFESDIGTVVTIPDIQTVGITMAERRLNEDGEEEALGDESYLNITLENGFEHYFGSTGSKASLYGAHLELNSGSSSIEPGEGGGTIALNAETSTIEYAVDTDTGTIPIPDIIYNNYDKQDVYIQKHLIIDSSYIDTNTSNLLQFHRDQTSAQIGEDIPTSNLRFGGYNMSDSSGTTIFYQEVQKTPTDDLYNSFILRRTDADGNWVSHGFYQHINANKTLSVQFITTASRDAWANGLNVVKKAGDTMTGNLMIAKNNSRIYLRDTQQSTKIGATYPSEAYVISRIDSQDKDNTATGWLQWYESTDGTFTTEWNIRRLNAAGTALSQYVAMRITPAGTYTVAVSQPAAWRSALGINAVAANASWNNAIALGTIQCIGRITGSSKTLIIFIPYNYIGGTATVTNLSLILCGNQTAGAEYLRVRSGSSGATYTQLGSGLISVWSNGKTTRTNEVASITCSGAVRSGFYINITFTYALCRDNNGTSVYNNTPVTAGVSGNITLS